jgi:hypothetical protein
MPEIADHPRPQLRRAGWTDLCGAWAFAFDDGDQGVREGWAERPAVFDRTIQVPYPPESRASGVHETGFHPVVWYRRAFTLSQAERGGRLRLNFGAVDYRARVWVNGRLAVEHEGGHTPFSADITPLLVDGPEQVIVVRAEDDPLDLSQPRGKQYWRREPGWIWYHRTSGVWQPVWLDALPAGAGVESLRWTPDLDVLGVDLHLRLDARPAPGARVRVRLTGGGQLLADDTCLLTGRDLRRAFRFDPDLLMRRKYHLTWAPHHPSLIEAEIELLDADGAVLERVESYFGLRRIEVQDGRFLLNGVPTFMRLVLGQNYWPDTLLAADDARLRREVELIKSLGFNGVRIHQKIENPRFLYWCDRLGLMVWGEAANAYVFDDRAAERLTREWLEAVRRDINHPCVVTWVPLNESWGVPNLDRDPAQRDFVKALHHLTKALDPTRPVISNDGWQHAVGDILGVHDYSFEGQQLRERYGDRAAIERTFKTIRPHHNPLLSGGHALGTEPVVISEFGGLSTRPAEGEKWFGYATDGEAGDMLARFEDLVAALLDSTALAGFLLHPAHRHRAGDQRPASGGPLPQVRPRPGPRHQHPPVPGRAERGAGRGAAARHHQAAGGGVDDPAENGAVAARPVGRRLPAPPYPLYELRPRVLARQPIRTGAQRETRRPRRLRSRARRRSPAPAGPAARLRPDGPDPCGVQGAPQPLGPARPQRLLDQRQPDAGDAPRRARDPRRLHPGRGRQARGGGGRRGGRRQPRRGPQRPRPHGRRRHSRGRPA